MSFLFVVPATTSHYCLQGHNRRNGSKPLQTSHDDSNHPNGIAHYKKELSITLDKIDLSAGELKIQIENEHLTFQARKECKRRSSLRGLPQIKAEKVSAKEWVEVLSDDFRRLAITKEFVLAAVLDTQKYTEGLHNLSIILTEGLCFLEQLSNHNKLELSHDITAAVVPRMYKNMTQVLADRRNCVILRDLLGLVADMKKVYNKVKKTGKHKVKKTGKQV